MFVQTQTEAGNKCDTVVCNQSNHIDSHAAVIIRKHKQESERIPLIILNTENKMQVLALRALFWKKYITSGGRIHLLMYKQQH